MILDEYQIFMREFYHAHEDRIPNGIKKIINKKVETVLKYNPYKSEKLDPPLEGLRSYHIPNSEYRIIFAICNECREKHNQSKNNCPNSDCTHIPDESIMLFTCGPHDVYQWMQRCILTDF
jgi:mRNA-degrading endonuclease RelE of RelBE toxin-antitoxin system